MRLTLALCAFALIGAAAPETPVAVELFTSQGCSSCPPADALVERLAKEPNTVVLTRPVTYWDRLGWKDTLAREENTRLQRRYAARGGEGSGVYTPQAMIQGRTGIVGSREDGVRALIRAERGKPGPVIRAVRASDGGRIVSIRGGSGEVSALALKGETIVRIGSGENGGRTVRYTNVVLAEQTIGRVNGAAQQLTAPGTFFKTAGADRFALLIRDPASQRIIAARYF